MIIMHVFNLFGLSLSLLSISMDNWELAFICLCLLFFSFFLISLIHKFNFLKNLLQCIILSFLDFSIFLPVLMFYIVVIASLDVIFTYWAQESVSGEKKGGMLRSFLILYCPVTPEAVQNLLPEIIYWRA